MEVMQYPDLFSNLVSKRGIKSDVSVLIKIGYTKVDLFNYSTKVKITLVWNGPDIGLPFDVNIEMTNKANIF